MQTALKAANLELQTQFELTTNIITKLNTFKLTPTAKLVLLYLTTCYNPKHKEVFPKQKTIADKLGVSERSVTRAIQELFNEGLILIECKYTNRYKFTSRIAQKPSHLSHENMSDDLGQNVVEQTDKLSDTCIEQIRVTKKQQRGKINFRVENIPQKYSNHSGGNVYSGDDSILRDYAIKHGAKNIQAYINTLKKTKSAEKIIKDYKQKNLRSLQAYKQTDLLREKREIEKQIRVLPETCTAWVKLGKKYGIQK